jgi:hypothetical protein
MNEIKRLGDTGISRFHNNDAFLVGAAANPAVESELKAAGLKYVEVTAPSVPELADKVDKLYGSIENPDTGVANMGNGMDNVMVGSMDGNDYRYLLPARSRGNSRSTERSSASPRTTRSISTRPQPTTRSTRRSPSRRRGIQPAWSAERSPAPVTASRS